ncbi:PhoPQ-activated pathogenicity-related protein [Aquisphaera giovannonii]|uniref:PhoPQ-activated pathogenicity-related protein n=1 Tax=Aquisphaera giovannonii TaxID=406548 RepID=A0A5B9W203_9BACT|nr:PhoPQ-activated protein PqaA family protein [Aquisphaera giovannonii]QEH34692.1 PhoPQ-activated pathogenicity-related protein [Aquisphaera giovannonii]
MVPRLTPSLPFRIAALTVFLAATARGQAPPAELDEYVKAPDPAYAWKQLDTKSTPQGTVHLLELTSQVWHDITWKHDLTIFEPADLVHRDAALLFITGGSTGSHPGDKDFAQGFAMAKATGGRVAILRQVPNQPLLGDRKEDDLISETFLRYLATKDKTWPLLFPMAKSAVRAMDAVQAWAEKQGKDRMERFVVTGASKRGWTTWLTGATDRRVVAIAPMVIVMLNLGLQGPNQLDVWGKYSEQIEDYVSKGLMEKAQTPEGRDLWKMVDPYTFRDRLTMPKMLINGANDRYWTLNALDLYWDGLSGPKYLVELPNAGHGLDQNRNWAIDGLGAFFRHAVTARPMPVVTWKMDESGDAARLSIESSPAPKSVRLWGATSPNRDFRESRWTPTPLTPSTTITAPLPKPSTGSAAYFADLEFEVDDLSYHLTTSFLEPGAPRKSPASAPR